MELNDYQREALRTCGFESDDQSKMVALLALVGEIGELCNEFKKVVAHGHDLDLDRFKDELGDSQWYMAVVIHLFGFDMEDVAKQNLAKLNVRYPDGFSADASRNRKI